MKTRIITLATILIITLFSSCSDSTVSTTSDSTTTSSSSDCAVVYPLLAGQHINAGNITITNDDDNIYVTYNTTGGWVINETHLYVGTLDGLPTNGAGNPQIGLFPYNDTHDGVTTYTITVPITEGMSCYIVAAHASVALLDDNGNVIQTETAWSDGNDINEGGSWATYSDYCLTNCCDIEDVVYEYYAGQTIDVGNLTVTNDETNLYVTFNYENGWVAGQTHLYVGSVDGLPVNGSGTPIPGHFPYATTHDPMVTSYTYTIPLAGLGNCFIIAAHSETHLLDGDGNIIQSETGWSYGTEFNSNRWGWYSEYCVQTCD